MYDESIKWMHEGIDMFYERELKIDLMKYLEDNEAIVVLGSRQVGKTTLLKIIMGTIGAQKRVFFLNREEEVSRQPACPAF